MSTIDDNLQALKLNGKLTSDFVSIKDYDLALQASVKQKLSPLDMNMPRLYGTRWTLCFPLSTDMDTVQVFEDLKLGLARTISSIPWISGNVVSSPSASWVLLAVSHGFKNSVSDMIVRDAQGSEEGSDPKHDKIQVVGGLGGVEFRCKDLTKELPSYTEMKKANFPFSRFQTLLVSPLQVIQASQPAMAAQANFIEGGLLLTVGVHHSVCDATGFDTIIDTWARNTTAAASSSESFSEYDPIANDRTPLSVGIPTENILDFPEYTIMPPTDTDGQQMVPQDFQMPPMTSKIFYFSPQRLAGLKAAANAYSTHDALCAFFWHHMTLARNPSLNANDSEKTSNVLLPVNIRGLTNPLVPKSYLGNAVIATVTQRLPVSSLTDVESGLIHAAAAIRSSIAKVTEPNRAASTISLLKSRPNAQDFKFACQGFLGPDIVTTSWADIGVRDRRWGTLGRPEGFRMPYEGADGIVVVLPRLEGGGLEVMVGLEGGAMKRMVSCQVFKRAAVEWA